MLLCEKILSHFWITLATLPGIVDTEISFDTVASIRQKTTSIRLLSQLTKKLVLELTNRASLLAAKALLLLVHNFAEL